MWQPMLVFCAAGPSLSVVRLVVESVISSTVVGLGGSLANRYFRPAPMPYISARAGVEVLPVAMLN